MGNKDPQIVKNLFLNQELNDQRVYGVKFWKLGIPSTVVIDDYIPTTSVKGYPEMKAVSDNKGL
jgi:hypothetical protein